MNFRLETQVDSQVKQKGQHLCRPLMLCGLQNLNVFGLPSLGAALHFEADRLTFLQRTEPVRLNGRKMNEYIFAILPGDETKTFGIVKPLYCSLFHVFL